MAEDIPGLMSPSAISRVSRDLPRREEPQRRGGRHPRPAASGTQKPSATDTDEAGEPLVIGSHLNVRV
jgi:hypothetical protein